jgi:hypothetical protein
MTSELTPVAPGTLERIKGKDLTVSAMADILTAPVPVPEDSEDIAIPFPGMPKAVELTPAARAALVALPSIFNSVTMTDRRMLSQDEIDKISAEWTVLTDALSVLEKRKDAIAETMRHHLDTSAEFGGIARQKRRRREGKVVAEATPRDHHGHYLLAAAQKPAEIIATGFTKAWQQRFTSGKTSQSIERLEQLLAEGSITRAEYLAFTEARRVLSDDAIKRSMKKDAGRTLQILAAITKRNEPNSSFHGPEK